jgi:hypothetical protein
VTIFLGRLDKGQCIPQKVSLKRLIHTKTACEESAIPPKRLKPGTEGGQEEDGHETTAFKTWKQIKAFLLIQSPGCQGSDLV